MSSKRIPQSEKLDYNRVVPIDEESIFAKNGAVKKDLIAEFNRVSSDQDQNQIYNTSSVNSDSSDIIMEEAEGNTCAHPNFDQQYEVK